MLPDGGSIPPTSTNPEKEQRPHPGRFSFHPRSAWKPWERSTGPRTAEGKAKVSQNAYTGGMRALLQELARLLRRQPPFLRPLPIQSGRTNFPKADVAMINRFPLKQQSSVA